MLAKLWSRFLHSNVRSARPFVVRVTISESTHHAAADWELLAVSSRDIAGNLKPLWRSGAR